MNRSENFNELAGALSKAQGEMEAAIKDSVNPHFKSRYADLAAVWDAARAPLTKHGLSVVQTVSRGDSGLFLLTSLIHSSGQWISSEMPLILSREDMQGLGSALTYARRYSLAAICGIAQDDDDAEGAVGRQTPGAAVMSTARPIKTGGPSEAQLKRLFTIANSHFWKHEDVKKYIKSAYKKESSKDLTLKEYDELCQMISTCPAPKINVEPEPEPGSFAAFGREPGSDG